MTFTTETKKTSNGSVLRIYANGEILVESVRAYLAAVEYTYNSAYVFDHIVEQAQETFQRSDSRIAMPLSTMLWNSLLPLTEEKVAALIPNADRLKLKGVVLQSPGFWELLGALSPLEFLRNIINDRHEQQKDKDYRNQSEAERLSLENELLKTKLINEKIDVLKNAGATPYELQILREQILGVPARALASIQEKNQISSAEIVNESQKYLSGSKISESKIKNLLDKDFLAEQKIFAITGEGGVGKTSMVDNLLNSRVSGKSKQNLNLLIYALSNYRKLNPLDKEIAELHLGIPDNVLGPYASLEEVAKKGNHSLSEVTKAYNAMKKRANLFMKKFN